MSGKCFACGVVHDWQLPCPEPVHTVVHKPDPVVVHAPKMVVHTAEVVHATDPGSRHGKYADPEARKAYRKEWLRKRRAGAT